jgi:DNA-directed RNA polymerase specialized sigma24 family protein
MLRSARLDNFVDLDEALDDFLTGSEGDPVLEVGAEQCIEGLEESLQRMSPKMRATFLLYRRDGLSMDEISARLGISRPMAKKYLVKALARFRDKLQEMDGGRGGG